MAAFPLEVPVTPEIALVFLLAGSASGSEMLDSLGYAPPTMVSRLSHECVRKDRVRITTPDTRYEVRVGRVDAEGLGAFKTRSSAPRPPDPMAWPSIARLDGVRSRFHIGMAVGAAAGGLLIGLPLAFSEGGGQGGLILAACTVAGGWIGGRVGSHLVREKSLYVAQPRTEARPALDPAAAGVAGAAAVVPSLAPFGPGEAAAGVTPEPAAARIRKASGRIHPDRLLRVTFSSMARIEGYASRADEAGLHALRPSQAFGSIQPLPDVIPWTRVFQVEKRGGSAGSFALKGGLSLGVVGGITGMAVGAIDGTNGAVAGGAAIGALSFGALGALLGAAIGAPIPRWHVVY